MNLQKKRWRFEEFLNDNGGIEFDAAIDLIDDPDDARNFFEKFSERGKEWRTFFLDRLFMLKWQREYKRKFWIEALGVNDKCDVCGHPRQSRNAKLCESCRDVESGMKRYLSTFVGRDKLKKLLAVNESDGVQIALKQVREWFVKCRDDKVNQLKERYFVGEDKYKFKNLVVVSIMKVFIQNIDRMLAGAQAEFELKPVEPLQCPPDRKCPICFHSLRCTGPGWWQCPKCDEEGDALYYREEIEVHPEVTSAKLAVLVLRSRWECCGGCDVGRTKNYSEDAVKHCLKCEVFGEFREFVKQHASNIRVEE